MGCKIVYPIGSKVRPVLRPHDPPQTDEFAGQSVWVAYSKKWPYLPIAVAYSADELAQIVGVRKNLIESTFSKYRHGKLSRSRFHKVEIGGVA